MRLVLDNVSFSYGSRRVFHRVSLSIPANDVTAILGVSGSGKSTLIRLLSGLALPTKGAIAYGPGNVPVQEISRAIVFQDSTLFPWKTVRENIELARAPDAPTAGEVAEQVGLHDALSLFPHQLSGGMKQRAEFARVLARQPAMLFLDEPFNRLDIQSRKNLQELFLRVHALHRPTTIFVTHDIREAVSAARFIKVLRGNPVSRIVEYQTRGEEDREPLIKQVEELMQAEFDDRNA